MTDNSANSKILAINGYLRRGWSVVPLHDVSAGHCSCGNADPEHTARQGGKHPIYGNWESTALRTPDAVAAIWAARPNANVGIATGRTSGIWVFDTDPDNGGNESLRDLVNTWGPLPMTYQVITGSGGLHHYFALPPDFEPRNSAGKLGRGLDARGHHGQVVAPPSVSGKGTYGVALDVPVVRAPRWMEDLLRPVEYAPRVATAGADLGGPAGTEELQRGAAYCAAAVSGSVAELAGAGEGMRNEVAFRVACRLHELAAAGWSGLSEHDALMAYLSAAEAAHEAALRSGGSAFGEGEALDVWRKAGRKAAGSVAELPSSMFTGEVLMPSALPPFRDGGTELRDPGEQPSTMDGYALVAPAPSQDQQGRELDAADLLIAEMLDSAGLDLLPPVEPLIDGLLMRDSLAQIWGASGHGKSFVALDMAAAVATGRPWHGRATVAGPVVYLVAEGARGMRKRVRAWERHHGVPMSGVYFLPRPVQAAGEEWRVLIEACRRIGATLVIIDTQARVSEGVNENDAKEMGLIVGRMEALRAATGACVLLVHHGGVTGERARGSGAIRAALSTELKVTRVGNKITIETTKQKDGEEIDDIELDARVIELGLDHAGKPQDSLVLVCDLLADPSAADEGRVLTGLDRLTQTVRVHFHAGRGGTKSEIKTMVKLTPQVWYRAWNQAVERKIICLVQGTSSWRWVSPEDRLKVVEGNRKGYVAPD